MVTKHVKSICMGGNEHKTDIMGIGCILGPSSRISLLLYGDSPSTIPRSLLARSHTKSCNPNWIVAMATVMVAIATIVYAFITHRLISEQRKNWLDDKFPCISVRARFDRRPTPVATNENEWTVRLVNIGRGPAFIDYFHTMGLSGHSCDNGDRTDGIDKVIGPDVGDPHLQVAFAQGAHPSVLRQPEVAIIIRYHDIAGRSFESGIREGLPFYEPPWRHGH